MKKRNLYLILLCIVTIAAICYGTFIHVGKPFMDISDGSFSFVYGSEGNDKTQEKINAFSSAKISLSGADVVLSSGDGYSLTYVGEKSRFPAYSVENSVLTVTDPATGDKPTGVLTVTIPESLTDFDTVVSEAAEEGYIKSSDVKRLMAFRNDPSDESWIGGNNG